MSAVPAHNTDLDGAITEALSSLALPNNNITLYSAGLPIFPSNFTRDSILSSILFQDAKMLKDQLVFCAALQGQKSNRYTGEEPGKIFHEVPPTRIRGLSTEYNACDTTALFIIGHEVYLNLTHDRLFIHRQKKYLEKAVEYILSHLINNLFAEDPSLSGAKRFALRVTYWKDSQVNSREHGLPSYPAVYTLAHVQNMRALRSAALLLHDRSLSEKASLMLKHLSILYNDKTKTFNIGIDQQGFLSGVSSDALHMLYYLNPGDLSDEKLQGIIKASEVLETPYGYRTLSPDEHYAQNLGTVEEGYHTRTVWPFEQAFIYEGAKKFKLTQVMQVAARIMQYLDSFPELFVIEHDGVRKGGAHTQLWTIAAKHYFLHEKI